MPIKDPAAYKAYQAAYGARHKERLRESHRLWRLGNPLKVSANKRRWRAGRVARGIPYCTEADRLHKRQHYADHRDYYTAVRRARKKRSVLAGLPQELQEMRSVLFDFRSRLVAEAKTQRTENA